MCGVTLWWPHVLHLGWAHPACSSLGSSSAPELRPDPHPPDPAVPTPSFHTQDTFQGPFLTEVQRLEARQDKRNYWQLLKAPNISLEMGEWWVGVPGEVAGVPHSPMAAVSPQTIVPLSTGIADYKPQNEETLILRLSKW